MTHTGSTKDTARSLKSLPSPSLPSKNTKNYKSGLVEQSLTQVHAEGNIKLQCGHQGMQPRFLVLRDGCLEVWLAPPPKPQDSDVESVSSVSTSRFHRDRPEARHDLRHAQFCFGKVNFSTQCDRSIIKPKTQRDQEQNEGLETPRSTNSSRSSLSHQVEVSCQFKDYELAFSSASWKESLLWTLRIRQVLVLQRFPGCKELQELHRHARRREEFVASLGGSTASRKVVLEALWQQHDHSGTKELGLREVEKILREWSGIELQQILEDVDLPHDHILQRVDVFYDILGDLDLGASVMLSAISRQTEHGVQAQVRHSDFLSFASMLLLERGSAQTSKPAGQSLSARESRLLARRNSSGPKRGSSCQTVPEGCWGCMGPETEAETDVTTRGYRERHVARSKASLGVSRAEAEDAEEMAYARETPRQTICQTGDACVLQ